MSELKKCPFCGGDPIHIVQEICDWDRRVCCADCGARGGPADSDDGSLEKWNHRPIEDALREQLRDSRKLNDRYQERCDLRRSERDALRAERDELRGLVGEMTAWLREEVKFYEALEVGLGDLLSLISRAEALLADATTDSVQSSISVGAPCASTNDGEG